MVDFLKVQAYLLKFPIHFLNGEQISCRHGGKWLTQKSRWLISSTCNQWRTLSTVHPLYVAFESIPKPWVSLSTCHLLGMMLIELTHIFHTSCLSSQVRCYKLHEELWCQVVSQRCEQLWISLWVVSVTCISHLTLSSWERSYQLHERLSWAGIEMTPLGVSNHGSHSNFGLFESHTLCYYFLNS